MFSPENADEVLAALGDKFLQGLVSAVGGTRNDLEEFRQWRPGWFPTMSDRCLANLIHDRLWAHMLGVSDEPAQHVVMYESGATREVVVDRFRLRLKRHHFDDRVSNYPTQTALDFWVQNNSGVLPGMEEITLAAGYRWHTDTKSVGAPVISYRDGQEKVIWAVELLSGAAGATGGGPVAPISWNPLSGPDLPAIDVNGTYKTGTEGTSGKP
jgi:hypothetical protein